MGPAGVSLAFAPARARFGAPLAVADGDVIRSHGDGERQGFWLWMS